MMDIQNANCEIRLRAMEPEDLDLLYSLENDMELWNIGGTNVPYSRYVLRDYIANATNDIYRDGQVRMMVETQAGRVVGIVDLINFDPKNQRAELGIAILKEFRGRGYGRATISQMLRYGNDILHLHQIYAYVDIGNRISLNCLKSLGFNEKAVLTDWLRFGNGYRDAILLQHFL
ncbi:GNAT family N-acetyltransferase [Prevotella dentasini]|uniref:GNAT family N-acetyltransferase n=1 Tax=Prevotella dentasini TaxID=589537 RepID=UPI000AF8714B|nr:GNAT family N-acetyltransferase [Prevotella dentasini]